MNCIRQLKEICDNKPVWKTRYFYMHISKVFNQTSGNQNICFPSSIWIYKDAQNNSVLRRGEEVCRWCLATGSRSSSLGINSGLLPLRPSPPGERWSWPESCRQLELINPAGNPSQAAVSETLRGRKGTLSVGLCVSLSWVAYLAEKYRWEDHFSFLCYGKTPQGGSHPPYCPHLALPLPLQISPNIPGDALPPSAPSHGLTRRFPPPQTRAVRGIHWTRRRAWPRPWTCFLSGASLETYRCKIKSRNEARIEAELWLFRDTLSKGRQGRLPATSHRSQRVQHFPNLSPSTPQHETKLCVIYPNGSCGLFEDSPVFQICNFTHRHLDVL